MVGASCVYPMDKIKTRLQSAKAIPGVTTNVFKDIGQTFSNIFRKEGFFGLYKGMAPQMVGIIPEKAIKITMNDFLKRKVRQVQGYEPGHELSVGEEAVAGIGTGLFQVCGGHICLYPFLFLTSFCIIIIIIIIIIILKKE